MREWRPQVLAGIVLLTAFGGVAMWLDFEQIAMACAAGIVAAVTALTINNKVSQ